MIDWMIDNLFGTWGRVVLDFIVANGLIFSLIVVGYGLVLVLLQLRLKPYRLAAVSQARTIIASLSAPPRGPALVAMVQRKFNWASVASAGGEGRLVAGRWKLWPSRVSARSLEKLIPISEVVRDATG